MKNTRHFSRGWRINRRVKKFLPFISFEDYLTEVQVRPARGLAKSQISAGPQIIAAVALPKYNLAVAKSRINRLLPLMKSIENAQEVYKIATGELATDFSLLDIDMPAGSRTISTASRIEYTDFGCTLSPASLECWDNKVDGMWLQKYYGRTTAICWTRNANGQKICKYLCKTELTGTGCNF